MSILVSVNCVSYNHEDYIKDAIESVLMQKTNFKYELIIGEDCSTDKTKEIVVEYAKSYPEIIRLITAEKNVGARENGTRIRKASRGKYIAICEGDDYWLDPYKLQKQVDYLEANPDCTFSFHNAYLDQANKKETEYKETLINRQNAHYYGENTNYNAGELALLGFIPTSSFIYRKEFLDNPPEWFYSAVVSDNSVKLITTSHGYAHFINEIMGAYRIGVKNSMMDKWRKERGNKDKQLALSKGYIKLYDNFNQYSGYKYESQINKVKIPFELQVVRLEKRKKDLSKSKYKSYFDEIGLLGKFKYYANYHFPNLYAILTQIRANSSNAL